MNREVKAKCLIFSIFFPEKNLKTKKKHGDVHLHIVIVLARIHSILMFGRKVITVNTFGTLIDVFSKHEKGHLPGSHSQPFNYETHCIGSCSGNFADLSVRSF